MSERPASVFAQRDGLAVEVLTPALVTWLLDEREHERSSSRVTFPRPPTLIYRCECGQLCRGQKGWLTHRQQRRRGRTNRWGHDVWTLVEA